MVGDDGVQADMVLEKELRVEKELYLVPAGKEVICLTGCSLCVDLTVTHFSQATPPLVPLPLWTVFFQTTREASLSSITRP